MAPLAFESSNDEDCWRGERSDFGKSEPGKAGWATKTSVLSRYWTNTPRSVYRVYRVTFTCAFAFVDVVDVKINLQNGMLVHRKEEASGQE
jgi:hypothetical protein